MPTFVTIGSGVSEFSYPQFTYGRQTVPDRGVVRSCDPLQIFWAPIISLERLNLRNFTNWIAINVKKSVCIRIGPRCRSPCVPLVMSDGSELCWVESVRYLGVFIIRSYHFSCSFDNAEKSFYRRFNAIFGKIGRIASADVVLHLVKQSKCIPILLYAVEACLVNRSLEKSLQFPITRILIKIFTTRSSDIVMECQNYFGFYSTATLIRKRKATFLHKVPCCSGEINIISYTGT